MGPIFSRCQQTLAKGGAERLAKCEALMREEHASNRVDIILQVNLQLRVRSSFREHEEVRRLPGKPTRTTAKERGQWKPTHRITRRQRLVSDVVTSLPYPPQPFPTVHQVGAGYIAASSLPPL